MAALVDLMKNKNNVEFRFMGRLYTFVEHVVHVEMLPVSNIWICLIHAVNSIENTQKYFLLNNLVLYKVCKRCQSFTVMFSFECLT